LAKQRRDVHVLAAICLVVAAGCRKATSEPGTHTFANGKVQVRAPQDYVAEVTPSGTLELTGPQGVIHLFLDLHTAKEPVVPGEHGVAFVKAQAAAKGVKVHEVGDKVLLMESAPRSTVNGKPAINMHWQIGFANNVVVMSLAVPEDRKEAAEVKRFFDVDMEQLIASLKRADA
jgi:hypothetical protein